MQISDAVIVRSVIDSRRSITVRLGAITKEMPEQEVLVYRKNAVQRMNIKSFGDGMELLLVHHRPFIVYELDVTAFLSGMSLFSAYDEVTDAWTTYVYKFSKDPQQIAETNELIHTYIPDVSLRVDGRFVVVSGGRAAAPDILQNTLKVGSYATILSLLFGLVVAYGTILEKDGVVHRMQISLPMTGSIIQYQGCIERLLAACADHGIYLQNDTAATTLGGYYTISTDDREVLFHMVKRRSPVKTYSTVASQQRTAFCKQELLTFMRNEHAEHHFLTHLDDSVLKLLKK